MSGKPLLMLYIEDTPASIRLMENIVQMIPGLKLITAPTAEVGLPLAEVRQPDIVILDINLPGMSGVEAAKRMRANPATKAIPLIALSANAMEMDVKRGLEAGFNEYLTKPISIKHLISMLKHYMDKAKNGSA